MICRSNRKTIKMLIVVLIVFATCWLPLNLYHIIADFGSGPSSSHNFIIFLAVHWLAMSSVVYNPFIYSIRNAYFRKGVKSFFRYIFCRCGKRRNSSRLQEMSNTRTTSLGRSSKRAQQLLDYDLYDKAINSPQEREVTQQTKERRFTKAHRFLLIWKTNSSNEAHNEAHV